MPIGRWSALRGNPLYEWLIDLLHAKRVVIFTNKVESARGFTATRILVDEAAFVPPNQFFKNIFIGMMVEKTFVLIISSPAVDANNVFTVRACVCMWCERIC